MRAYKLWRQFGGPSTQSDGLLRIHGVALSFSTSIAVRYKELAYGFSMARKVYSDTYFHAGI